MYTYNIYIYAWLYIYIYYIWLYIYIKIMASYTVSLQQIEKVLLGSNIDMPLSHVVARTSPLNLQVGRGKTFEACRNFWKLPRLQRMGWVPSQRSIHISETWSDRPSQVKSIQDISWRRCCDVALACCMWACPGDLEKKDVWYIYESRAVWCLIIIVPNSYPCQSVSGILVNIRTTAADVASVVSQPVCNVPSPWQLVGRSWSETIRIFWLIYNYHL